MEAANKMAPPTIDRLCDIADVYGGMGGSDVRRGYRPA